MFAEREPWRHDAEVACLKSGAVRERAGLVRIDAIEGPGICGADFPLKVAVLGDSPALGYTNQPPRPPGIIPGVSEPRWPIAQPPTYTPPPASVSTVAPRYAPPATQMPPIPSNSPGAPLQLGPPIDQSSQDRSPLNPPVSSYPMPAPQTVPMGPPALQYTGAIGPVEVKPAATLACPIVSALDHWIAQSVQPASLRWFAQPVIEIKQISAFSCRSMNNQRGARISEHAFGNAIDVAAFVLADGRIVKVKEGWRGRAEEQGFLRDVQAAACDQFNTVLAPGADAFHYDHIHVDLMRRASGRRICLPAAADGEQIAARAQQRNPPQSNSPLGNPSAIRSSPLSNVPPDAPINERNDPYAWRGSALQRDDNLITGSIGAQRQPAQPPVLDDFDWIEDDGPRPKVK